MRSYSFLPRVWAMRKIGFLMDEMRLRGEHPEVKNEIIRLAKLYGILTPFTSYLVQEDELVARGRGERPQGPRSLAPALQDAWSGQREEMVAADTAQRQQVGGAAVTASRGNAELRDAGSKKALESLGYVAAKNRDRDGQARVNFIDSRTFYLEDGRWVDAAYDGQAPTRRVQSYSREYFDIVRKNPAVGRYLAQGERVVVLWNGEYIETEPAQ